jgi:hypothetical protein
VVIFRNGIKRGSVTAIGAERARAAEPLAVLVRGEGGAFSVRPNMDALRAIYAMPPGGHPLYADGVNSCGEVKHG